MNRFVDVLGQIWDRAVASQPAPSGGWLAGAAAVAIAAVLVPAVWAVTRHVITLVHEAGHAIVAVLVGRRLSGIRLHSDTSGLTVTRGAPRGPGMVATFFAGYVSPGVLGLAVAWVVSVGHAVGMLWAVIVALAVMLVLVRNLFGLWTVLACGVGLGAFTWWATPVWSAAAAGALAVFLLVGAVRATLELWVVRSRRGGQGSDADRLAQLTRVPGFAWVAAFLVVDLSALGLGALVLLGLPA